MKSKIDSPWRQWQGQCGNPGVLFSSHTTRLRLTSQFDLSLMSVRWKEIFLAPPGPLGSGLSSAVTSKRAETNAGHLSMEDFTLLFNYILQTQAIGTQITLISFAPSWSYLLHLNDSSQLRHQLPWTVHAATEGFSAHQFHPWEGSHCPGLQARNLLSDSCMIFLSLSKENKYPYTLICPDQFLSRLFTSSWGAFTCFSALFKRKGFFL